MGIYLHDWKDSGKFGLIADFDNIYISEDEYNASESPYRNVAMWLEKKEEMTKALAGPKWNVNILLASYTYEDYSGDAFVLYEKDGKLFEVHGGHCSCYGLEGQWEPEETTVEALRHRLEKGYGMEAYVDELKQVLDGLENK